MEQNFIRIETHSFSMLGARIAVVSSSPVASSLTIETDSFGGNDATSHTFHIEEEQSSDEWIDHGWATAEWRILSASPSEDYQYEYLF